MHTILLTRGISDYRDKWKKFMETQMFPFTRSPLLRDEKGEFVPEINPSTGKQIIDEGGFPVFKKGEPQTQVVQGSLRPLELWEYVYPKQNHKSVMAMLNQTNDKLRPEVSNHAWLLRKAMKLKKMPEIPKDNKIDRFLPMEAMAVYPIGVKQDIERDFIFTIPDGTKQGWHQEGL